MSDRHLQGHEPAITVPQHGRRFAAVVPQRLGHAVRDRRESARHGGGRSETGQGGQVHRKVLGQGTSNGLETVAVRQKRVEQPQRRTLPGSRDRYRGFGDNLVHSLS